MSARSLRQPVSTASRAGERTGAAAGPSSPRPRHTRCPQGFDTTPVLHGRLRTDLFRSVQRRSLQRSGWRVGNIYCARNSLAPSRRRLYGGLDDADRSEVLADEGLRSAQRRHRPRLVRLYGPGMARSARRPKWRTAACPAIFRKAGRKRSRSIRPGPMGSPITRGMTIMSFATRSSIAAAHASARNAGPSISTRTGSGDWPNNTESDYRPEAVYRRSGSNDRPRAPKLECETKAWMRKARSRKIVLHVRATRLSPVCESDAGEDSCAGRDCLAASRPRRADAMKKARGTLRRSAGQDGVGG